jgi:hypothetical protein
MTYPNKEGGVGSRTPFYSSSLHENPREKFAQITQSCPPLVHRLIQEVATSISGKPHYQQVPLFESSRTWELLTGTTSLAVGIFASSYGSLEAWPVLPVSWLLTVGGARKLQVTVVHHCVHREFFGDQRDKWLGQLISTVLLTQNLQEYSNEHVRQHHNHRVFASEIDPDRQLLEILGIHVQPTHTSDGSISTEYYWQNLWKAIFSFRLQAVFLRARFRSNFLEVSARHRIATVAWVTSLTSMAGFFHMLPQLLLAIVLPLTILYHVASLLQFLSEHSWWSSDPDLNKKSHGRFCFEAPPSVSSILAWCGWIWNMIGHIIARVAVVNGDLPCHDWHHTSPREQKNWPNSTYARQRQVEAGVDYIDLWGLPAAIDHVFQELARANSDP